MSETKTTELLERTTINTPSGTTVIEGPAALPAAFDYRQLAAAIIAMTPATSIAEVAARATIVLPARNPKTPNQGRRMLVYPDASNGRPWVALCTWEYGTPEGYLECVAFPPGGALVMPLSLTSNQYEWLPQD